MEKFADIIMELLQEKIRCYGDLADILVREREAVIRMEVDSIWNLSREKNILAEEIKGLGEKMKGLKEEAVSFVPVAFPVGAGDEDLLERLPVPRKIKADLQKAKSTLHFRKQEVQRLSRENCRYIKQYLGVIDDVMATVAGTIDNKNFPASGYGPVNRRPNAFIHAEV